MLAREVSRTATFPQELSFLISKNLQSDCTYCCFQYSDHSSLSTYVDVNLISRHPSPVLLSEQISPGQVFCRFSKCLQLLCSFFSCRFIGHLEPQPLTAPRLQDLQMHHTVQLPRDSHEYCKNESKHPHS